MQHRMLGSAKGLLEIEAGEEDEAGGRGLQSVVRRGLAAFAA